MAAIPSGMDSASRRICQLPDFDACIFAGEGRRQLPVFDASKKKAEFRKQETKVMQNRRRQNRVVGKRRLRQEMEASKTGSVWKNQRQLSMLQNLTADVADSRR
jgi:hypothetical protein